MMADLFSHIVLGLIQGLTEFFPVSSSGHLVIAQEFLDVHEEGILLEVLLHVATVLVVIWFYRAKVFELLAPSFDRERNRYRLAVVAGLVPTGIAGIFLKDWFEQAYDEPYVVLLALAGTGVLLLATRFAPARNRPLSLWAAFVIGIAQSVAILPGVSRSGATIAAALFLGVERKEAARFSFLLSVPAILGAALLTILDMPAGGSGEPLVPALAGMLVAAAAGFAALRMLVRTVLHGRFDRWGWYCIAVAAAAAVVFSLR